MSGHCSICDEPFSAALHIISAASCGHTFHQQCLSAWTSKSQTCPQCRLALDANSVISRLYFSASPESASDEEAPVLRAKIEKLEGELEGTQQTADMQAEIITSLEMQLLSRENAQRERAERLDGLRLQLELIAEEERKTVNELRDRLRESQLACEGAEARNRSALEDLARVEREARQQRAGLLVQLDDTKEVVRTQLEAIENLEKCICGEERPAERLARTQESGRERVKQLEYANRTLANQLQKYRKNEAISNSSSTDANADLKLHEEDQTDVQQLANCCNVLKSELLNTKDLLRNEQDCNSKILQALRNSDFKMAKTLSSVASGEASAMDTIPSPSNTKGHSMSLTVSPTGEHGWDLPIASRTRRGRRARTLQDNTIVMD